MRKVNKFALLILCLLLIVFVQPVVHATGVNYREVNETVYATTVVNVRSGPGTEYDRIAMLRTNESVQRIGIDGNGWSKIIYNGRTAYIYSAYLAVRDSGNSIVDYSQLTRQIAIANGLKQADFTVESWSAMTAALKNANEAMNSGKQDKVDAAQLALAEAIAALEKMNYISLEVALRTAYDFTAANTLNEQWANLLKAIEEGEELLASGDQAAADAAAVRIQMALADIEEAMDQQLTPEIIVQEIPVEVPPTDDYCNISIHPVWPVLLVISLIFNAGLVGLIVVYVARKRKKLTDDIPLVDYDIDDDI